MSAVPATRRNWPRWWRRFQIAARRANIFAVIAALCVVAFVVMSSITWISLNSGWDAARPIPSNLTATLLVGMLVPAMALIVLLGRYIALQRAAESIGGTGQMHVRLVFIFSLISAIPTLLVVVFASWLFQSGVEFWFSDNSRGLLENANKLARGYYEQTVRDVGYESAAMAQDSRVTLESHPVVSPTFQRFLAEQVLLRNLSVAAVIQIDSNGEQRTPIIVDPDNKSENNRLSKEMLERLDKGEPYVAESKNNRIVAGAPIERQSGVYLLVARTNDLVSLSQGQRAENIVQAYEVLTSRARIMQLQFNVALFVGSLALVGLSVWFALRFADRQVQPLYELVEAARRVGAGNYSLQLEGRTGTDEIGLLNRAFNRMTAQIDKQTQALLGANRQLHERRLFIEAVLESVTSGIISLDEKGCILLMNSSALKLTNQDDVPEGMPIAELAPAIATMIESDDRSGIVQYSRGGELLTLAVKTSRDATGHVITFEDITRQLVDQRTAAWSDVARRIAHEIKNPLTPIQLATERLSRRYRKQITDNPELFEDLTATIIRQVGDLRRMVDEFSSFARLPKPVFRAEDPVALTRQALFLQEVARPDVDFTFAAEDEIGTIDCDRHQFGQAMTNVLKNAVEATETKAREAGEDYKGRIAVDIAASEDCIQVRIADNGIGLSQARERIIEPYVTTREKGTGLGLAIVNKIVEEHGGDMTFTPAEGGGTVVTMRFAADPLLRQRKQEAAE
ncbi:ATP-binding protein [Novosphingobium mangrovi (ex Hu et al. 2023)]|uniref:histidine kinase n=1 Tax=Novosphingobium mangrovi (ex Hu et al. 2023) TaxID=2930094 RepID=A0ABT0AFC2_9SPHN|nr:ATP-binding protein [Novosphingobium mangrovi (ex Hu et al. 2023)]MCJ1961874.1 ATP-binding protein [Novosphingobium mangrovi (ex Hu et al. 2023)]